jgi:hypothetical protein
VTFIFSIYAKESSTLPQSGSKYFPKIGISPILFHKYEKKAASSKNPASPTDQ